MKRKIIELIEYDLIPLAGQKRIFDNHRYKSPFVIQTKTGIICTVAMKTYNGFYYFEGPGQWCIEPEDVDMIEDRIWDHIKA